MIRLLLACLLPSLLFAQWTPEILWDHSGETAQSHYGSPVLALGDQNDDGFADWGVVSQGAAGFDSVFARVDLYHGGNPPSTLPYRSFEGGQGQGLQVISGQIAGDLNGDGYTDWEIWTRYWSSLQTVYLAVYAGGPAANNEPLLTFILPLNDRMLRSMGDFNGDGYDDLFRWHQDPWDYTEIYFGSATPDTVADWTLHSPPEHRYLALASSFGDLNGDHLADFVGSTPAPENYFHAFYGSAQPDTLPDVLWSNYQDSPTQIVPDLNRDGFDDLITGTLGTIRVHLGGSPVSQVANYTLTFSGCDGACDAYPGIGDVNADGFQDFAAVNSFCFNHWGKAAIYLGYLWLNSNPVLEIYGRTLPLNLVGIRTVCGLGDVNGDGVDDFAIGATNDDNDGMRGRVVVISGNPDIEVSADEPPFVAQDFHVRVFPNPFNSTAEIRYTLPRSSHVSLKVFDVTGREIATLVDRVMSAGEQRAKWNAEGAASGVYFVRFEAVEKAITRKVLLVR